MEEEFKKQLQKNARRFSRLVDRIAEKYSKLQQYEHDAIEVDLDNTQIETLEHYMTLSKKNVNKISKTFADLKKESQPLQDHTRYPQLDNTCNERSDLFETTTSPEEHDAESPTVVSPLDKSRGNYTMLSDLPEDQDEQLEMSLSSQGSSLGEVYPDLLSQIGNAWRRQHVSEVADSVLRRYRRWRKSNRTQLTNSFHAPPKPNHVKVTRKREVYNKHHHNPTSPVKSLASVVIKTGSLSPAKMLTSDQKLQKCFSPLRRSEAPATAVVMDMSTLSEQQERECNKTFTVYEPSLNNSMHTSSPSRSSYPSNGLYQDLTFRRRESCLSPRHMQTASCSGHAAEKVLLKETYSSPVRQSPYKSRLASRNNLIENADIYGTPGNKSPFRLHSSRESPQQSPYGHVASPKSPFMKRSISREASEFKSASNFSPSMLPKITVRRRRTLEYSDLPLSSQLSSPQLGKPQRRHHGLRRNLSFDSSSNRESCTTEDFDNDLIKYYHKLVCLNKSAPKQGHPCRFCVKNSEATRGHSFSNLAALALSPHRPLLRKRYRDLDISLHSKRFKGENFTKYL